LSAAAIGAFFDQLPWAPATVVVMATTAQAASIVATGIRNDELNMTMSSRTFFL
jgi:hypothetical protein